MLNKFAVFSVVTIIGLFNIGVYVLFIQPAGFGPQVTSLVSLNNIALVLPPPANNSSLTYLKRPSTSGVLSNNQRGETGSSSSSSTVNPMDVKFLDRTLMQSATNLADNNTTDTGRNSTSKSSSSSSSSASSSSAGDVSDETSKVPCPLGAGSCPHRLTRPPSTKGTGKPVMSALPVMLPPLSPPPTLTTQPNDNKKAKGKTKGSTKPPLRLSTVVPPPMPRTDAHNYSYVINRPDACSPSGDKNNNANQQLLLVVFVCAAPANFVRRQAIRDTWGSAAQNRSMGVRLLFLLGATANRSVQQSIEEESANHADVVQENFLDTYNNLTIKSVMLLKWVERFCPRTKFVLKTDDDSFINLKNLVKYLSFVKKRKRMLFGRLVRGARPVRLRTSKWFAPLATFRERIYPDYLSGSAYAMSVDVAHALYNVSLRTPLFHLEDVFITGICARKAGVVRKHHGGFTYDHRSPTGCAFRNAISGHRVNPDEMHKIWEELQHKNMTTCR